MALHGVILAGGRGERFWPLSRKDRPKQFLPLLGDTSLLQQTFARMEGLIPPERRWVVAGENLMPEIRRQIPSLAGDRAITEPIARNTAAAIGAAAAVIEAGDAGAILLVLPSDHWIPDADAFRADAARAAAAVEARDGLHLFGIPIAYPETGFGYVQRGPEMAEHPGTFRVARFHEKPDRERALAYASRPEMLWNSGIFVWRAATILEALLDAVAPMRSALPALREALGRERGRVGPESSRALDRFFEESPSESIDYAVLERHAETYVHPAGFRWSDVGTWLSWGDQMPADALGNRGKGKKLLLDTSDCVLYSEDGLLALLGVRDLIVVRLPDVTLVCARDRAQDVRRLVRDASRAGDLDAYF